MTEQRCCRCGEHKCSQLVIYPIDHNSIISVDRCLVSELNNLWNNHGIETVGSCCGHFQRQGYIQVKPNYLEPMWALGYEQIPPEIVDGALMGQWCFKPKTEFEFNGYYETGVLAIENDYDVLSSIAESMLECIHDNCAERYYDEFFDKLKEAGVIDYEKS